MIAAGTAPSGDTLHRSQSTPLAHWSPALGPGVEAHIGVGTYYADRRWPLDNKADHPSPGQTVAWEDGADGTARHWVSSGLDTPLAERWTKILSRVMGHAGTAFECLSHCWVVELPLVGQGYGFDTGVSNGVGPRGVEGIIIVRPGFATQGSCFKFWMSRHYISCQVVAGFIATSRAKC